MTIKCINEDKVFVKSNFVKSIPNFQLKLDRKKQFVYCGRLDEVKGIKLLFNAWKLFNNNEYRLIVCGTGELFDWCNDFIKTNNITNIDMLKHVKHDDMMGVLSDSLGLIFPSKCYEGMPMTIIEAFSVGTPVICNMVGNAGEMVSNRYNGILYEDGNVESLVYAIKELIDMKMYDNAFNTYLKMYDGNRNIKQLNNIYDKVLKEIKINVV